MSRSAEKFRGGTPIAAIPTLTVTGGLTFAGGRLLDAAGTPLVCESEEQFYEYLGLPFIAAEIRHGEDEIDAARNGGRPGPARSAE